MKKSEHNNLIDLNDQVLNKYKTIMSGHNSSYKNSLNSSIIPKDIHQFCIFFIINRIHI
jgi:hypothetical protein